MTSKCIKNKKSGYVKRCPGQVADEQVKSNPGMWCYTSKGKWKAFKKATIN